MKNKIISMTRLFSLIAMAIVFITIPVYGQKIEVCIFDECEDVSSGGMSGGSNTSMSGSSGNTSGGGTTATSPSMGGNNEGFVEDTDKEEILLLMKNLYSEELTPFYELLNIINNSSASNFSDHLMILTASISNLDLATKNLKQLNSQLINAKKNKDISSKSLKAASEKLRCAFKGDSRVLKKIDKVREDSINKSEVTESNRTLLSKIRLVLLEAFNCKKAAVQIIDGANLFPENGVKELITLEGELAEGVSVPN